MALIEDDIVFKNLFGYGGITPQLCKDCTRVNSNSDKTVTLTWRNPPDTWLDNQLLVTWKSTWIVKKKGSFPESVYDGERIFQSKEPAIIQAEFVDRNFTDDEDVTDYFYMAFPVSDTGAMSVNSANRFDEYLIWGFIEHMDILDPDSRIEYTDRNTNYQPAYMDYVADNFNYGSWETWWWLEANKPWMVKFDGRPDYPLDPNNYRNKADGSGVSDITNTAYEGGAYAWLKRIYKYEKIEGSKRIVKFCDRKAGVDYKPIGFCDEGGNILEGLWLPMYYGTIVSGKMRSMATGVPENTSTTDAQYNYLKAAGTRHVFLGGAIMETLKDIEYMLAKSTNIQEKFGAGYTIGGSQASHLKPNQILDGGAIYGKNDSKSLGKIFHSLALGSYQICLRDPYWNLKYGVYHVSPNYIYDITANKYENTGIAVTMPGGWQYPTKYALALDWGAVPIEGGGSTVLGSCDGFVAVTNTSIVAVRLGCCSWEKMCGAGFASLGYAPGLATWTIGSADLLLPPVGVSATNSV